MIFTVYMTFSWPQRQILDYFSFVKLKFWKKQKKTKISQQADLLFL